MATIVGNVWVIPENTKKPIDLRAKSGKYVKKTNNAEKESRDDGECILQKVEFCISKCIGI